MKTTLFLLFSWMSFTLFAQGTVNSKTPNRHFPLIDGKAQVEKRNTTVDLPQFGLIENYWWDSDNKVNNKREELDTLRRTYQTNGWLSEEEIVYTYGGSVSTRKTTQFTYSGDGSITKELELETRFDFPETPITDTLSIEINRYNEKGLLIHNHRRYKNTTSQTWYGGVERRYTYDSSTVPNTYFNTVYSEEKDHEEEDTTWRKYDKIEFFYDDNGVANRLVMSLWVSSPPLQGYITAADYRVNWKNFDPKDAQLETSEFNYVRGVTYFGDTSNLSLKREYDSKGNLISEMTYEFLENGDSILTSADLFERTFNADDQVVTLLEKRYEEDIEDFINYKKYYFSNFFEPTALSYTQLQSQVYIFPNPAQHTLRIAGLSNDFSIQVIHAASSKICKIQELNKGEYDVSSLLPGIYYVNILSKDGSRKNIPFIKSN